MKRVLDIAVPPITSYSHHASLLSILATESNYLPWFCTNYIQSTVAESIHQPIDLDFYFSNKYQINIPSCSLIDFQYMEHEAMAGLIDNIVHFFEEMINKGYYIYTTINCSVIPDYNKSDEPSFHHYPLIYGYDSDSQEFYCGDFFREGKFEFRKINYNYINLAYLNTDYKACWWNGIKLLRKDESSSYHFNFDYFREVLSDYRNNVNSSNKFQSQKDTYYSLEYGQIVFGIDNVCKRFLNEIKKLIRNNQERIDYRSFAILADHKKALEMSVNYLMEHDYIEKNNLVDSFSELYEDTLKNRNLFLKFTVTRDGRILERVYSNILEIFTKEKRLIDSLIEMLNNSNNNSIRVI